MRIGGQYSRLYEQRRIDSDHPAKGVDKAQATHKDTKAAASHLSQFSSQLLDKLRKVDTVRPKEVERVIENLRAGQYSTPESTQATAAAILTAAEKAS